MGPQLERTLTVVGVVPDTRYRDLRDARPSVYFPLRQSFFPYLPMTLAIRTSSSPAELVPAIRRAISESEPGVALASAAPFETFLGGPLAQPRLNALLLAVFAGAAVALAAVGLFGVMATMVRQRTRELGVRMALGATGRDLRRMVMRRGSRSRRPGWWWGCSARCWRTASGSLRSDRATLGVVVAASRRRLPASRPGRARHRRAALVSVSCITPRRGAAAPALRATRPTSRCRHDPERQNGAGD
jgi:hypothetical protein